MKPRASPSLSISLALGVGACTAPGAAGFTSFDAPPEPVATTTAPDEVPASTSIAPDPETTEAAASTSTGEGSSSGAEPFLPPTIVEHAFGPDPLALVGPITTLLATANADGVRMQLDDEDPIELQLAEPDSFAGELAFFSAKLDNGDHKATFVPWREELTGWPLVVPFTVALPASGSEAWWQSDSEIGTGAVVALAVTPNDELIEFGTYYPMGEPRCYLRHRDLAGSIVVGDSFIDIMPDTPCSAIDLVVDADGALHMLATIFKDGDQRWWLGKTVAWAAPFSVLGTGSPGETAHALASDPTRVAVCGTKPAGNTADATAWIFAAGKPGNILSFDYVPEGETKDTTRETPRDCAFSKTHLVLAGNAWGKHDPDDVVRDRHFILEIDVAAAHPKWLVAGPDSGAHSQAHALTIDSGGRYITGGQSCDEACNTTIAEFRMFLPGAEQIWHRYIAPDVTPPRDIAWSPAGYFVFVSSMGLGPNDTAFLAQAWVPLHGVPFWSYDRHDAAAVQSADALAIGPYGQVYAGGVGDDGYPAVAIIAP